jgi:prepilin-type N-terminal cleavage/methylation domain-containing protein
MTMHHQYPTPRAQGFSLVELLMAMAITSILMLTLFGIVGQTSTNYRLTQRKVSTLADSRSLFHFLDDDIASRVANTRFFLQTGTSNQSEFAFVRTRDSQDSNDTGDLDTSIYYVAFTADDANSGSPKLFRRTLGGADTQKLLEQGNTAAFPTVDPEIDEPLAYHVLRFSIEAKQRDPAGHWQAWDKTAGTSPSLLEITFEVLDDLNAQRLPQEGQWTALAQSTEPQKREAVRRHIHRITLTP